MSNGNDLPDFTFMVKLPEGSDDADVSLITPPGKDADVLGMLNVIANGVWAIIVQLAEGNKGREYLGAMYFKDALSNCQRMTAEREDADE